MRANLIFDNLTTSTLLLDSDAVILEMNPAAENFLGVSLARARGHSLLSFTGHEAQTIGHMLERASATGQTFAQDLVLVPGPHCATERIVDCRVTPLGDGEETRLIVELADITRRVRLHRENALLEQHGASRKMVRQLAHEIKNPLGGIRGAAQLLGRRLRDESLSRYTAVIITEADRLAALVDALLGPGGSSNKTPVNVHAVLEHVARLLEAGAGSGREIRRDYDPGLPMLNLDRDQMVQAILNIASNALSAIGADGQLTFRTRAVSNFTIGELRHRVIASIEIEDDGPGIPLELRDSIFFPLVTGREGGTGLGLPLAQELVNRHGGLIEFDSRPGCTIFYIRLPLGQRDD